MFIFYCGVVRFLGGHGARNTSQAISRGRTVRISGRRALSLVLALSLALGFVGTGGEAAATTPAASASGGEFASVFGATQSKVKKSKSFRNWETLKKRYAKQEARLAKGRGRMNEKAASKLWTELIESLQGLDPATQVEEVNNYFNALTYQSDAKVYDTEDYWATPYQFLSRAKGDCEDFAAAKYFALRALGFESSQLRLVVGYDRVLARPHAITLVVVDGRAMMLDSIDDAIVEAADVTRFEPLYSVTESDGWFYKKSA